MQPLDTAPSQEITTRDTTIFIRTLGKGPALLLLHGFPQTHLMWRNVASLLANHFTLVCADLRGYGRSGCPPSDADHRAYSKRVMANDMASVMDELGYPRFSVAGHDRGGRVAYRLALDHPGRVERLAVLDILPISEAWNRADKRLVSSYWPWSLLSQPAPLPERLIYGAPDAVVENALTEWGSPSNAFSPRVRDAYIQPLRDPSHVHAICEEFRAAATIDHVHDREDLQLGRRIPCPVLALWSVGSPLDIWYADEGGPLAIWRRWADEVQGWAIKGGHFFPEEAPEETADAFIRFFGVR